MPQPSAPETLAMVAERIAVGELSRGLSAANAAYAQAVQTVIAAFVASRIAAHDAERRDPDIMMAQPLSIAGDTRALPRRYPRG